jgi:hypothetical protein
MRAARLTREKATVLVRWLEDITGRPDAPTSVGQACTRFVGESGSRSGPTISAPELNAVVSTPGFRPHDTRWRNGHSAVRDLGRRSGRCHELYRVVVFLEGFALELPAPFRQVITVPFGGDGDPDRHEVPFDGRVTVRGTFLRPVTPGTHLLRAIFTSVDPDSGGPSDGRGIAPRTIVIDRTVEIRPNHPPVCATAQPSVGVLWPANHKLVAVRIVGVTDPDGDPLTITVTRVTQDEPVTSGGDGDTTPDAVIRGAEVALRAERSGRGNGRVYGVNFTANDGRGGTCSGAVLVCVPHDDGQRRDACVDDGQRYSSTEPRRGDDDARDRRDGRSAGTERDDAE